MSTIWVREFTGGLDRRRLVETSPGGTLTRAVDCHITRGGEVEQRADFVLAYTLPAAQTKGLLATSAGLTVFGHQATPAGLPAGITYQRLQHPSGEALSSLGVATLFRNKIQAIGKFGDGSSYVFYDGARVTDVNAPPNLASSGMPVSLLTQSSKMYVGSGPNLFFSAVGDSTDFTVGVPGVGEGFIVMSTHAEGSEVITALGRYDEYTAIFSRRVVQVWFLDVDPDLNRQAQVLANTGAIAPRSVTQFGDGDLFYLDRSGIRSLRARDSSNSASTTDIGSPIDPIVVEAILSAPLTAEKAIGIIEPRDGRFWLSIGDRIYVFSYFSASQVSAWSEYQPGFVIDDMVVFNERVYLRSGDKIYVYGGLGDRFQYSADVHAEAWMPYMDGETPTRIKQFQGVDAAVRGAWEIRAALDSQDENASDTVARVSATTFHQERVGEVIGQSTHISLRFRSLAPLSATEPAILASAVVHFRKDKEEDS